MGADGFFRQLALAQPGRPGQAILTGLFCGLLGLAVRGLMQPLFGGTTGLTILVPTVLIAALWGGQLAGYMAMIISIIGAVAMTQLMGGLLEGSPRLMIIGVVSFTFAGLFGILLGASLRSTLRDLDDTVRRLRASDTRVGETTSELRAMVEQASAGIARVGLDGKIISANARFARILGLTQEQTVGITTGDVTHPDDIAATLRALEAARAGGEGSIEKRYIRPDGSVVWALTSLRALSSPEGEPMGYIAVAVDITAAKAAEAALRESESRFRLMADTAPSAVWMTNTEAELEFVNTALVEFYGGAADQISGTMWRQSIHPDDMPEVEGVMAVARPSHRPYGYEARFSRFNGEWRWMRVAVNPRFDANGEFLGYVGMAFDMTETRVALDALGAQERRQTFLLSLTDRLRNLTTPDDIMAEVERSLGDTFGADRVGYGEVDQARGLVSMSRDWTAGVISAQGQFSLADLGADLITDLADGRFIRIADVRKDPRTRDALEVFERLETRALMRAPVMRNGQLRAFLYAHDADVREWTDAEAELLQEVAGRTWTEIERARAEGAVRESEERFRSVADTAPVLIWVTGQDRVREFVNQAYVAYNGGTYEDARLRDWRSVIHVDDHERILRESVAGEATGQPFSMEARYLRHDGEYRWLKSFSRPRLDADGEIMGFVGVAFDVTDIREAQARLMESETRFRTVADSAPAQMWMTDDTGDVIFANKRYRTFFDIRGDENLQANWTATLVRNGLEDFNSRFLAALAKRDRFEGIMEIEHPQMGRRWLRCDGIPRFDGDGRFQGYVGANIDVTEARQAEDDLKRINELLEERVSEAIAEKAKAEADLMHAQRMEAVGRLTGGVAHDFNNLLTVVIGALDMMLRAPDDKARQKKLGEAALAAARRGEGLTHQLLAFSRRQALRPEALDLNGLIRESEPLLRRAVGEAVEFKLKLRRGGARVNVDPSQFEAALLNLVVNARDALGDKGRITVQTQSCVVQAGEVHELPPGDYVCVTVADNGTGIDPEVLSRVFEPFFTTKAIGKGTGLGLSQVYGFARQSGGGVRVASTLGRGAEIHLYLPPLDRAHEPERAAAAALPYPHVETRRILLVEDDASVAAIALELLTSMGMDVAVADTAPRALEMLKVEPFDLMLSDVVMPGGMTGIELARVCAVQWPNMRIVLTSGYAGEDVDAALSDAPWPFLRKPYSGEQLAEILGQVPAGAE